MDKLLGYVKSKPGKPTTIALGILVIVLLYIYLA